MLFRSKQQIRLSRRECELLHALASRPNAVISKPDLGRRIWGVNRSAKNNVEVHISQVRRKLRALGAGTVVRTVRGYGYMMVSDPTRESLEARVRAIV